jgi:hypothetical protein
MYPAKPDVDRTYGYIMQYENSGEFQYANGLEEARVMNPVGA